MGMDDLVGRTSSAKPAVPRVNTNSDAIKSEEKNQFVDEQLDIFLTMESVQKMTAISDANERIDLVSKKSDKSRLVLIKKFCASDPEQIRTMTQFSRIGLNYSNLWDVDKSSGKPSYELQSEFQAPKLLTALTCCPNPAALRACPFEIKMKEVVIPQLQQTRLESILADLSPAVEPNPRHLGRTLIYTTTDGTQYAVKLLKAGEDPAELDAEGRMQLTFTELKAKFGLKSDFPGCVGRGQFQIPQEHVKKITDANKVKLQPGGDQATDGNCLVYEVKPGEGYFDYINQIPGEFQQKLGHVKKGLCSAAYDIFACAAHGWMYTQLADLYHSKPKPGETRSTDGGRALMLVGAVRADDSSVSGMGSVKNIHSGTAYPNIRRSGLADVGDATSMQALSEPLRIIQCLASADIFGKKLSKGGSYNWDLLFTAQPKVDTPSGDTQVSTTQASSTSAEKSDEPKKPKYTSFLDELKAKKKVVESKPDIPDQPKPQPVDFRQALMANAKKLKGLPQLISLLGPQAENLPEEKFVELILATTTESKSWEACAHMVDLCRLDSDQDLINRMRAEVLAEQMLCVMLLGVTSFLRDGSACKALKDSARAVILDPGHDLSGDVIFRQLKDLLLDAFVSAVQGFCGARLDAPSVEKIVKGLGDFESLTLQLATFCTMSEAEMNDIRKSEGQGKDALMKRLYPRAAQTQWTMDPRNDNLESRKMAYEPDEPHLPSHLGKPGTQMPIKEFEEIAFNLAIFLLSSEMQL